MNPNPCSAGRLILIVAGKDLRILMRDRGSLLLLFLLPVLLMTVVSLALSGLFRETAIGLPVADLDRTALSRRVFSELDRVAGLQLEKLPPAAETGWVRDGALVRDFLREKSRGALILIPAGFEQRFGEGSGAEIVLLRNPSMDITAGIVSGLLEGVVSRLSAEIIAARAAVEQLSALTGGPVDRAAVGRMVLQGIERFREKPPMALRVDSPPEGAKSPASPSSRTIPGYAVMFALFNMLTLGHAFLRERSSGTARRLLAAPLSRAGFVAGKLLAGFLTALLQMALFFSFGRLAFGMDLGGSPLGLLAVSAAVALAATGMGILMASLAKSEAQLTGLSVLLILLMSSLGGSWWPLELVPDFMRRLAHFLTINAWAVDGFDDLFRHGRGAGAVLPEAGVLFGIAAAAFAVGLRRFRLLLGEDP